MKKFINKLIILFVIIFILIIGSNIALTKLVEYNLNEKVKNEIEVSGIKINYQLTGAEKNPPLLLIHDMFSSSQDFSEVTAPLSQKYRVIALDLPGFGLSSKNNNINYSRKNLAVICNQFMAALGYKKYSVLGHSTGGEVALNLSLQFKDNIEKLILVDSAGLLEPQKNINLPPWLIKELTINYYSEFLNQVRSFNSLININFDAAQKNLYYNRMLSPDTLKAIYSTDDSGSIKGNLKDIKTPTLIIWGGKDKIIPISNGYELNNVLPSSTLIIFENSGHNPFVEAKDMFVKEVLKF